MAQLNFPSSPTHDQVYEANNTTWLYDSDNSKWYRSPNEFPSILPASQANMEAASSTSGLYVTPSVMEFAPSSSKAWGQFDAGVPAINADYNVTSLTDNGTGDFTMNWTNSFTGADNYGGPVSNGGATSAGFSGFIDGSRATSSLDISLRSGANSATDTQQNDFVVHGELA